MTGNGDMPDRLLEHRRLLTRCDERLHEIRALGWRRCLPWSIVKAFRLLRANEADLAAARKLIPDAEFERLLSSAGEGASQHS